MHAACCSISTPIKGRQLNQAAHHRATSPSFCKQNFMSDTSRLRCGERRRPMMMPRHVVICWSRVYTKLLSGSKLYVAFRPANAWHGCRLVF